MQLPVAASGKRGWWLRAAALAAALLQAACSGDQASFMPPEPPRRPPLQASANDLAAAREHQRLLALFGGEYRAPAAKQLLEDLVARIARKAPQATLAYEVTILNSATPNAFALPNGRLYVTRGLLALANDTAEAAAVLAHEMAHVVAKHASERAELQLRSALVAKVATDVLNDSAAGPALQAQSKLSIASFSRQQELEADRIGVGLLARAGIDPYGAQRFLVQLGRSPVLRGRPAGEPSRQRGMDILSTHPSTPERISQALMSARQISAPGIGESDRNKWFAVVDGVAFGDDPAAGVVRGRRYLNSSLNIAFDVPSDLSLEAGREAVIGASSDGRLAFRFDVVTLDAGQTLQSYIASRWIEGVTVGNIEATALNGNQTVTASGKGTDWSFRMAAVRAGALTYRFILAGNGASGDLEAGFRSILDSFHALTAAETRATAMPRLRIVTASAGDTVNSLAATMAVDSHALERFLALNGLERNSPLVPGQRYKIVAE